LHDRIRPSTLCSNNTRIAGQAKSLLFRHIDSSFAGDVAIVNFKPNNDVDSADAWVTSPAHRHIGCQQTMKLRIPFHYFMNSAILCVNVTPFYNLMHPLPAIELLQDGDLGNFVRTKIV
jgi:hypothetical protein